MLAVLAESALRSMALGGAVWLALKLLRLRDPQVQMTAWTVVLLASLAMPLLMHRVTLTLPATAPPLDLARIELPGFAGLLSGGGGEPDLAEAAVPPSAVVSSPGAAAAPTAAPTPAAPARGGGVPVPWDMVTAALYALGAGILTLRLHLGIVLTWRLVRAARPVSERWAADRDVRISEAVGMPVTFASTILLPPDCFGWTAAKRQAVLSHEGSHVARGDFYLLCLAATNRALFWFNPFSWWLHRRLAELAEMISDDAAIAELADRPLYADVLLDVARSAQPGSAGLAMARAPTVRLRLERILATGARPVPCGPWTRIAVAVALLPLVALSAASLARAVGPAPVAAGSTAAVISAPPLAVASAPPFAIASAPPVAAASATNLIPRAEATSAGAFAEGGRLADYVGFYAADATVLPDLVLTVTRSGEHLFVQRTGQARVEYFPDGDRRFISGVGDDTITFASDGAVLQQNDMTITAPRVDAAAAARASQLFDERFAEQARPRTAVTVDPSGLDRHVGLYRMNPRAIFTVSRQGEQLFAQVTGQRRLPLYPAGENEFFYKDIAAQITFLGGGEGGSSALVLHQNGRIWPSPRVDVAAKEAADARFAARAQRRAEQERVRTPVAVDPAIYDRYVGFYEMGPNALVAVTRAADQLFAQVTGEPRRPILPEGERHFFFNTVAAQITFTGADDAAATGLILHRGGQERRAARIADMPRPETGVEETMLGRAVGRYELDSGMALTVLREDDHLLLQETGGPSLQVFAQGPRSYASSAGETSVTFLAEGDKPAEELILLQPSPGARRATRIDEARASAIEARFAQVVAAASERFKDQTPAAGSQDALRDALDGLQRGAPDYARMTPRLADILRQQLTQLHTQMTALGAVESVFFKGVGPGGFDVYGVKFAGGAAEFRIRLTVEGLIEGLSFRPDGDGTAGGVVDCGQEAQLRSTRDSAPIKLLLFNRTGADIRLYWLDSDGRRVSWGTVADDLETRISTRVGHPYVVTDAAGQCLEIIVAGQSTRYRSVSSNRSSERPGLRRTTPLAGSEEALRRHIEGLRRGEPDYERMTQQIAFDTRRDLLLQQAILERLGAVRAVIFRGVGQSGNDVYQVHFTHGSAEWRIGLVRDGRISNLALGPPG
jgi:hypothetical protein